MAALDQKLKTVDAFTWDLVASIESWKFDHDQAMRVRDFEESLPSALDLLNRLIKCLEDWKSELKQEWIIEPEQILAIEKIHQLFFLIVEYVSNRMAEFERLEYEIAHVQEFLVRLRYAHDTLNSILTISETSARIGTEDVEAAERREISRSAPRQGTLLRLAKKFPPPESWFDEEG